MPEGRFFVMTDARYRGQKHSGTFKKMLLLWRSNEEIFEVDYYVFSRC